MMPNPIQAFRKTIIHRGDGAIQDVDVDPMSKRRHPRDPSNNAYTEIKMSAYRVYMARQHASIRASKR